MEDKTTADYIEKLKKKLDEPFINFDDHTLRLRRNLLLSSSILFAINIFGIKADDMKLFDITFRNATDSHIKISLSIITAYFLIYFLWSGFNCIAKWRLRLSGESSETYNKALPLSKIGFDPTPLNQSTAIKNIAHAITRIDRSCKKLFGSESKNTEERDKLLSSINDNLKSIEFDKILYFTHWFKLFSWQQKWKLWAIDYGGPIAYGFLSITYYIKFACNV
ncbi:hypothetical protein [Desulfocurvus sp. DL9XJH121]